MLLSCVKLCSAGRPAAGRAALAVGAVGAMAAALWAPGALAQEAEPSRRVGAVVVVKDAKSQRLAPQAAVLLDLFRETGVLSAADLEAWDKLAAAIKLDRASAVDQLLGRRFVLVMGEHGAGPPRWTAMSDVTRETGLRLVEQLKPSPRGTKDGRPVWTLENGRFELSRSPAGEELQTLTLSPADSGIDPDAIAGADLGVGVKADIWARVYLDAAQAKAGGGGAGEGARQSLDFAANRTTRGWDMILSASPALMGIEGAGIPETIAGEPTEARCSDSVLLRAEGWATGKVELPADHPAVKYFASFAALGVPLPSRSNLGPRYSYVLERTRGEGKTEVSMTAAIEVKDLGSAAEQGDAMVAGFLNMPTRMHAMAKALSEIPAKFVQAFDKGRKDEPRTAEAVDVPVIQHAGHDPSAVRVAMLKSVDGSEKGKSAVMSWVYLPHAAGGEGGWWVIHMGTGPDAEARAEQVLRDTARDLEMRRSRFPALLLEIRPAALHGVISGDGVQWGGWIGAMRLVDYAKVDLWRGPDGRVQGHAVLDMVIPAGAAGKDESSKTAPGK